MIFPSILASLEYHFRGWPELSLAFLCYLCIRWYLNFKNQVLANFPIVGALPYILKNFHRLHDWYTELASKVGYSYLFKGPIFGGQMIFLTCDPRNVEYILKKNFSNFPKGQKFLETLQVLGQGIISVETETWHHQRKLASKMFAAKEFRSFAAFASQKLVEDALLPTLDHVHAQASVIDLQNLFLRYAFDSSCAIILGRSPGFLSPSFPSNEFSEAMDVAREIIFNRNMMPSRWWKLLRWLGIGAERKVPGAIKAMDRYTSHYVSLMREDLQRGVEANCLLAIYMNSQEERKDALLDEDEFLKDTSLALVYAGRDTVASGLTYFFYLISKTPRVENKLLEELRLLRAIKNTKRNGCGRKHVDGVEMFDLEELRELTYLEAALYESMRLYPPSPLNLKSVLQEDVLPDGSVVRPGMQIIYSTYAMGRLKSIWGEDCLEFKPERWLDDNGHLKAEAKLKFFGFSIGPRNCIGKEMAFAQMKPAAAAMLFNFQVQVLEGQSISPKPSTVLQLKHGLKARITRRIS
ncbi:PREDICTED: alkane hydroxylase MAH1-like [Nelumbo nucifera]|uniref:Alkane hydroxylase MAH1-like n=1 Tax=Nelumbo nucifera TaxID=4432 RepID=A0A1U7YQX5_NELNU|nr:PREDICTED: alkane hydroxylase MAH1-like [Nelumbo nucifera]